MMALTRFSSAARWASSSTSRSPLSFMRAMRMPESRDDLEFIARLQLSALAAAIFCSSAFFLAASAASACFFFSSSALSTPAPGAALAAGAAGYCNGHAAPEVLRQVAMVVENGGIWVGQGLMQRLLAATSRLLPEGEVNEQSWRAVLTPREHEAAILLAKGASNKEIARQLDITERTVKSHVSAMLEKLGARDRLQLSLIINGIEKAR